MNISERIKILRQHHGYTQEELAKKLGFKSRSSINKIEVGLNDLSQSQIIEFAKAFEVTPNYLLGWDQMEPGCEGNELSTEVLEKEIAVMPIKEEIILSRATRNELIAELNTRSSITCIKNNIGKGLNITDSNGNTYVSQEAFIYVITPHAEENITATNSDVKVSDCGKMTANHAIFKLNP